MSDEKPTIALLKIVAALQPSFEIFDNPISGLELVTVSDAERWKKLGYLADSISVLEKYLKGNSPKSGRPKKIDGYDSDCMRAFMLWHIVQLFLENMKPPRPHNQPAEAKVADLISLAREIAPESHLFRNTTSENTLTQSVSRGRTKLGIDKLWRSATCEKFYLSFSQEVDSLK